MSEKPFDGTRRVVASGGRDTSNDFDNPGFGDSVTISVDHRGGPRPEGHKDGDPITLSPEGMTHLLNTMNEFVGKRIMSRLEHGKSAEKVEVTIDVNIEDDNEVKS